LYDIGSGKVYEEVFLMLAFPPNQICLYRFFGSWGRLAVKHI